MGAGTSSAPDKFGATRAVIESFVNGHDEDLRPAAFWSTPRSELSARDPTMGFAGKEEPRVARERIEFDGIAACSELARVWDLQHSKRLQAAMHLASMTQSSSHHFLGVKELTALVAEYAADVISVGMRQMAQAEGVQTPVPVARYPPCRFVQVIEVTLPSMALLIRKRWTCTPQATITPASVVDAFIVAIRFSRALSVRSAVRGAEDPPKQWSRIPPFAIADSFTEGVTMLKWAGLTGLIDLLIRSAKQSLSLPAACVTAQLGSWVCDFPPDGFIRIVDELRAASHIVDAAIACLNSPSRDQLRDAKWIIADSFVVFDGQSFSV